MLTAAPARGAAVAVCVPAYGRPADLAALLRTLSALDHPRHLVQVIVAIDGPDPALEQVARAASATTVVLPVNVGSYAARNAAVDAVNPRAEALLFTDTDCCVLPGWVAAHLAALRNADASGGAVRFTMSSPPRPAEWVDAHRHLRQEHFVRNVGFAATCNLAVRRGVFDVLRFDPTLRSGGDHDFGHRLGAAGGTLVYADDAVVEHSARASAAAVLRKVDRVAAGAAAQQRRGHNAVSRRDPQRGPARRRHGTEMLPVGPLWHATVAALDAACSLLYARRVPSVVMPALRRRLPGDGR